MPKATFKIVFLPRLGVVANAFGRGAARTEGAIYDQLGMAASIAVQDRLNRWQGLNWTGDLLKSFGAQTEGTNRVTVGWGGSDYYAPKVPELAESGGSANPSQWWAEDGSHYVEGTLDKLASLVKGNLGLRAKGLVLGR